MDIYEIPEVFVVTYHLFAAGDNTPTPTYVGTIGVTADSELQAWVKANNLLAKHYKERKQDENK